MWSGATVWSQPRSSLDAVDGHHVRADPVDLGAHLDEHAREVLHVRLGGGVADDGVAGRQRGGHQRVLGRHHGRLVHQEVARREAARRGQQDVAAVLDARAERLERVEVRIEPAAADHVAAGRRHQRAAVAREQRAGEQERGADALGQLAVDVGRRHPIGADRDDRSRRSSRRARRAREQRRASPRRRAILGTLRITTSSSVSSADARIGSAPFLLPAGTIVPDNGTPPWMTNFSMSEGLRRTAGTGGTSRGCRRALSQGNSHAGDFRATCAGPSFIRGIEPGSRRPRP